MAGGPSAALCNLDQLRAEVADLADLGEQADWTTLRRLLSQACRTGLLDQVTPAAIDDFSIVFGLSAAQRLHLHDVIHHAKERG